MTRVGLEAELCAPGVRGGVLFLARLTFSVPFFLAASYTRLRPLDDDDELLLKVLVDGIVLWE